LCRAFRYALAPKRIVLSALVLTASACQTIEDSSVINTWRPAPLPRHEAKQSPARGAVATSLQPDRPVAEPTVVEGTGRFVGDRSASSQNIADQSEEGVTLNLVNVPAAQAAKTILGDMLGVRYTIDPKVEGRITIQTPHPVARSAAIDLFQSALRSSGAAIVNANGMYKIVPVDLAPVGAIIQTASVSGPAQKLGSSVQVVQLKYVAASEIRRILEPIAPRGGIVRADDARRTVTLSGSSHEIASMMEAISLFDVDVMKGMSFALVPVRTSEPTVIADELRTIFSSDQEGPMAGMVQFLPNKRLGAILVISPQRSYLTRAADWVRRLDAQAADGEKQFFTYAVQNRGAQELVDVLQSMFSREAGSGRNGGGTRNVAPQYQEASVLPSRMQQSSPQSFSSSAGGMSSTGSFARPSGMQGGVGTTPARSQRSAPAGQTVELGRDESSGEPRIRIVADEAKNSILIEATPADYRRVMRVVGTLDVIPNQVLLAATIAEVTLNDELKFGVRWHLQGDKSQFTFSDAVNGAVSSVFPGFSYALTASNIALTLNALNQITDVNVISSPSLTVLDNRTAFLQIGDQVPITTQSAAVLGNGASVVNSVSYRDTGVILAVTPRINQSGRVLLDVEQEVSNVAPTTSSGIDSPTIRQRRVRTTVVVNDGEALVLGGLIQDSRTLARKQVPIFGDIPVIGNVFKHKDNDIGKTELVIMITPHVVRTINEARQVTDEFRRELSISTRPEIRERQRAGQVVRRVFD
jgi:general secretion pathway protein D